MVQIEPLHGRMTAAPRFAGTASIRCQQVPNGGDRIEASAELPGLVPQGLSGGQFLQKLEGYRRCAPASGTWRMTLPDTQGTVPSRMPASVLFPAPLGPITAHDWPARSVQVVSGSNRRSRIRAVTLSSVISGGGL